MGVVYQRMLLPIKYMSRRKDISIAFSNPRLYDDEVVKWQLEIEKNAFVQAQIEHLYKKCDVAVFQTIAYPWAICFLLGLKEKYKKPTLMEIDDYMFDLPASNVASNVYKSGSQCARTSTIHLEMSDGIITSTNYLKRAYSAHNKNIYVVRNGIDFEVWDNLIPSKKRKHLRIGFAGGPNHTRDVEYIARAVLQIRDEYPNVDFMFFGCVIDRLKNQKRIKTHEDFVDRKVYPQHLKNMGFDIGLAPLVDNQFNRSKSNLRWQEYSALGIPTIASPIIPFKESIEHNKTGLLAKSHQDWVDAMRLLINDEAKRKAIGQKAYYRVKKDYDVKKIAKEYADILMKIGGRK